MADEFGQNADLPTFKCLLVGDLGVGKSSLMFRASDNTFQESGIRSIGVEFKSVRVPVSGGGNAKLQLWDVAGSERFAKITQQRYQEAHAVIFCYDTTNKESFDDISAHWIAELKKLAQQEREPHIYRILVGNKADLTDKKVIQLNKAKEFASANGMEIFETSAKSGQGINELLGAIAKKLVDTYTKDPNGPLFSNMTFKADAKKKKKGGCSLQ